MQLSRFTDFSLRVLLYLAINRQKRATLQEIADFYPLSLEHLRKVVHALARAGYLLTYRGKNGGMELARPPKDILIGEVVRQFEGQENLVDCEGLDCRLALSRKNQPWCGCLSTMLPEMYPKVLRRTQSTFRHDCCQLMVRVRVNWA